MTITLPADVRAQAERQAKAAGFASVEEYVAELVREDAPPVDPLAGYTYEELGKLLDETRGKPIKTIDDAFWIEQRMRLMEFVAQKEGKKS